jgi:alkylation response protein AidB-like acyl-CoA dehydrogenase
MWPKAERRPAQLTLDDTSMYDLRLSAEQLVFRDTVRDFVAQEIKPVALKSERLEAFERPLLTNILDQASQMGLRAIALPEDCGGAGADLLTCCIVVEELTLGDVDVAAVLAETMRLSRIIFGPSVKASGDRGYLPRFLEDDRFHLAVAGGADTRRGIHYHRPLSANVPPIKAMRANNGDFILSGSAGGVRNAPVAKLFAVVAMLEDRPQLLLVPADTTGLSVRGHESRLRAHGVSGDVVLSDCVVGADQRLDIDPTAIFAADERGGPLDQALNLGIGRAAYEAAIAYVPLRVQGGRRIIEHQAIGTKLAEIAISLEIARAAVWRAAFASDHPDAIADRSLPDLPLAMMSKVFTSAAIYRAAKDAAELFGAMGVMRDMPLQKHIHDAFVCLHTGNGNADDKLRIAEALAEYRRS